MEKFGNQFIKTFKIRKLYKKVNVDYVYYTEIFSHIPLPLVVIIYLWDLWKKEKNLACLTYRFATTYLTFSNI